jgi:alkylhydroperoxidase family enzyme
MPRLREVPPDQVTNPIVAQIYRRKFGPDGQPRPTVTGAPGNWETVFAGAPEALEHAIRGFALWRSPERDLDPLLRELALTRTGWAMGSQFVYSQHCKVLRGYGGTEDQVRAIPHWELASCYSPPQRAVLAYTDCLCFDCGRVPDELFDELRRYLSEIEVIELTYITCMYVANAVMTKALRLEFDDRDDPVVEVPPPSSFTLDAVREPLVLPRVRWVWPPEGATSCPD